MKAVTIVVSMGGVSNDSAQKVAELLGRNVPKNTLSQWQRELKPTIVQADKSLQPTDINVSQIVADMRQTLLVNLSKSVGMLSESVTDQNKINEASLRDRYVSLGIGTEKVLLVAGRSPELDNLVQRLIDACNGTKWTASAILEDVIKGLEHRKQIDNNPLLIEASNE